MARMPSGAPQSVADPDGPGYEDMIRQHNAENRRLDVIDRKIADTADLAGNVVDAAHIGPAAVAVLSGAPEDLQAVRAIAKVAGPLSSLLSTAAATSGFKADRANGMPLDEAFIKHAGGLVLGAGIGGVGSVSGAIVGAPGGPAAAEFLSATGGHMGQKDGEDIARRLAGAWGTIKRNNLPAQIRRTLNEGLRSVDDPSRWTRERGY